MNVAVRQKWYVLNITGSTAERQARAALYMEAAHALELPFVIEHNRVPEDAKDTNDEPFYGPEGDGSLDTRWCLAWHAGQHPPSSLHAFWDKVDALQKRYQQAA